MRLRKIVSAVTMTAIFLIGGCAGTKGGGDSSDGVSLLEAIEQSADKVASELPRGSRVAIVAFESENDNLSEFIMAEMVGALFDRGIEVADRQNLDFIYREFEFQMSGDVDDEQVKRLGKFMAVDMVINGQLIGLGRTYRYRTSAVHMEEAKHASITRLTVRGGEEMKEMITALANQNTTTKTARYSSNPNRTPQTAGTFLDRGILFLSRKDYDMAITDFSEALRLNPDMEAAYFYRGLAHQHKGDLDRAIADYSRAIQINFNLAEAYSNRGVAYANKGDFDRAIADYETAIRINPNDIQVYYNRGSMYFGKGDYDRAIAEFSQAIQRNPDYNFAYNNRGNAYARKGDLDRAIADYSRAIQINPDDDFAYNNRGIAYGRKGDIDRAIADCSRAIQINPNYADAYFNRGVTYFNKGEIGRAIADFEAVLRIDPNNTAAKNNLEIVRQARGQ